MKFSDHEYYNCRIVLDNSQHYNVNANWLHNQALDKWQGWSCEAGHTRMYIDSDNNVYGSECQNDQLGNLDTGWKLLPQATTCRRSRCTGCTDDLITAKHNVK